jgi:urease accessory protein
MDPDSKAVELAVSEDLALLRLLHLADSALPIGSLAHSFGLETLVAFELLDVKHLPDFLKGHLQEAGVLEAVALRQAFQLAMEPTPEFPAKRWLELNDLLSALKPARESRTASATLGRNFLRAAMGIADQPLLEKAWKSSAEANSAVHQSPAFGLVSAVLNFNEGDAVLAFLHQMGANLVSVCQRLLPLGQSEAVRILWNLKPAMIEVAASSAGLSLDRATCTMPLLDWGAMEHPALPTRLFVS